MDQIENLKDSMSRMQRYRLAEKTMRYHVYTFMEKYVIAGFILLLFSIWVGNETFKSIIFFNSQVCVVVGVLHYFRETLTKPWLLLGAATEALIIYGIFSFQLNSYFVFPGFGQYCLFLFVVRFWQRGEHEVNSSALANYEIIISNKAN